MVSNVLIIQVKQGFLPVFGSPKKLLNMKRTIRAIVEPVYFKYLGSNGGSLPK
jgi:hypothetical protein